jgi:hypothetical protein
MGWMRESKLGARTVVVVDPANSTVSPGSRKWPRFLSRREAPRYLKDDWGITRAASTLARLASVGGGPVYKKFGRAVVYDIADLDAWVEARISAPMRSTSDATGRSEGRPSLDGLCVEVGSNGGRRARARRRRRLHIALK